MQNSATVLVVDDMSSNAQIIEAVLEDDYNILLAQSGQEALDLLQTDVNIDLVLLDIIMPGMDGYTVCEKIKANPLTEHIPVIFLTSEKSEESEEKGFSVGGVDYITKPIRPAILSMRVKTHITLKQVQESLREMALHDQLTSLYNRHYLENMGKKVFAHANRHKHDLGIVMLDIDHFKRVNDTYGHDVGDIVLKELANLLLKDLREEDIIARVGGEEFILVLNNSNLENSLKKVENLRLKIESLNPNNLSITASFGITQLDDSTETFDALIKEADLALYESKNNGRNRSSVFSGETK